ncbi:glycosyltransferase [Rufibacter roseus]|uniref:Glycosyltransferase n=1 Tax=Rufibacter roseus TaxID=1567108 RepID=A0ABW2DPI9_9BACT|nr:glycosyltransferase [Rufibacter roseus]
MNVLYITYDGITDHIGQSQVAPYLIGLSAKGHKITLLSAEKMERADIIERYKQIFSEAGVEWHYVPYHKNPPVLSSIYDVFNMRKVAKKLIAKNNIGATHCRSYVAALVGLHFKRKAGIKFIFDMRDFWPDARKEIKVFDVEKNPMHKAVYQYFKKQEKAFLQESDHIVSLTEAGKRVMVDWRQKGMNIDAPISVIPCCADFNFYNRERLDPVKLKVVRKSLGINDGDFVLNYLGSLGAAYLTDEMMDVFNVLLAKKPSAKFLIIANNDHHLAIQSAESRGIPADRLIVIKGNKEEVPYLIAQADLSLFFIIPSFAKQACSPTKLAELLAMNIPVIGNTKIGDVDEILRLEKNNSAVMKAFTTDEYDAVLTQVLQKISQGNDHIRNTAENFSLECGIDLYNQVYQSLN